MNCIMRYLVVVVGCLIAMPSIAKADYTGSVSASKPTGGGTLDAECTGEITWGASDSEPAVVLQLWRWNGSTYVLQSTYNEANYTVDTVNRTITMHDTRTMPNGGTFKFYVTIYVGGLPLDTYETPAFTVPW